MKNSRIKIMFTMLVFAILLSGCASSEQKEIATAIEGAMDERLEDDTDLCLFRYKDVLKQVLANDRTEKSEAKEAGNEIPEEFTTKDYKILVRVPNLTDISSKLEADGPLEIPSPDYDLQTSSSSTYMANYRTNFSQVVEPKIEEQSDLEPQQVEVIFHVQKSGDGFEATIEDNSYYELQEPTHAALDSMVQEKATNEEGFQILVCKEKIEDYLEGGITDAAYSQKVKIENITPNADGTFTATLSYPDAEKTYTAAEAAAYAKYEAEGKVFSEYSSDEINSVFDEKVTDYHATTTDAPQSLELDDVSLNITGNTDLDTLIEAANQGKTTHQEALLNNVNANLIWRPMDRPASSVLQGDNTGTSINIHTKAEFGDVYLTFYKLPGEDIYEDGPLALSAYVRGGDTFSVRLPAGNYKLIHGTGDIWYGEPPAFGPYGIYQQSDLLIKVESGNIYYDLTLYGVENGNLPSTNVPFPY